MPSIYQSLGDIPRVDMLRALLAPGHSDPFPGPVSGIVSLHQHGQQRAIMTSH